MLSVVENTVARKTVSFRSNLFVGLRDDLDLVERSNGTGFLSAGSSLTNGNKSVDTSFVYLGVESINRVRVFVEFKLRTGLTSFDCDISTGTNVEEEVSVKSALADILA